MTSLSCGLWTFWPTGPREFGSPTLWPLLHLHWFPPGRCALPPALHPLHQRLHIHTSQMPPGEIRWRHSSPVIGVGHLTTAWICSSGVCRMVQIFQTWTECQKTRSWWPSPLAKGFWGLHSREACGCSWGVQIPGHHLWQPSEILG